MFIRQQILLDYIYYWRRLQIPSFPALSLPPVTQKCVTFSGISRTYPLGLNPRRIESLSGERIHSRKMDSGLQILA